MSYTIEDNTVLRPTVLSEVQERLGTLISRVCEARRQLDDHADRVYGGTSEVTKSDEVTATCSGAADSTRFSLSLLERAMCDLELAVARNMGVA